MKMKKEDRNIHLKEQMMFSELLDRLEERQDRLHIEYDEEEGAAEGFGSLFSDLQEDITLCEEDCPEKRSPSFDPSALPREGELLIEGERLCLLAISEKDCRGYLEVEYDSSFIKEAFTDESFLEKVWESFFQKNKAESLQLLMKALKRRTGERIFRGRVDADNESSISMMRKIGAKAHGISEVFLRGERLAAYEKKNKYLVDDRLKELAKEFKVEPQELIGHALDFWIELPA